MRGRSAAKQPLTRDIVVIGASAGGIEALRTLVGGLPEDFPASVFIVVHISPTTFSLLPSILTTAGSLTATHAADGERFRRSHIYVAPPDHHLVLRPHGQLGVSRRGPRENGFRPAVDPLFRTAARHYGARVIGVILTGGLDDGTIGMSHIQEHGGVSVVQDPTDAVFPSMPESAIRSLQIDHILPVRDIPGLLVRLTRGHLPEEVAMESENDDESPDVAEVGQAALLAGTDLGPPTDIICPECGGSLWELTDHKVVHYRCHVGHSYTADTLLEGKNAELEGALWGALRALEESAELRRRMASRLSNAPMPLQDLRVNYERQAEDAEARAAVLRTVLGNGPEARRLARLTKAESEAVSALGNEDTDIPGAAGGNGLAAKPRGATS